MTEFLRKSFTVGQRGTVQPERCEHGMVRPRDGSCCFCGAPKSEVLAFHNRPRGLMAIVDEGPSVTGVADVVVFSPPPPLKASP